VLPAVNRMRRSADFTSVVRTGTRAGAGYLVVHHSPQLTSAAPDAAPLVGFVVGKNVGNSVVRHRTARRLRAQVAPRLGQLPAASGTVIRALPAAGAASSAQLDSALENAFGRLSRRRK
jgi:ribonuclease P protein component